ncbi:MAG: dockerin type I repeat-containing protein [Clostridia bacterium]|nr:dockerin type I repeat-containing protein [Clostridia bacterium]
MKRLLMCLIALIMSLCTVSVSAAEGGMGWDGENSILVTVTVDADKDFAPEDFSEIDCIGVTVAGKKIDDNGYTYDLILQIDTEKYDLIEALEAVSENPVVTKAIRNVYDYLDPILVLSSTEHTIRIGESYNVDIVLFDTYNSNHFYYGIAFTVDPEKVDLSAADENTFGFDFIPVMAECSNRDLYDALYSGYDAAGLLGEKFGVSPINRYYTMVSEFGVGGEDAYRIIEALNGVLYSNGVIAAEPVHMEFPCARMPSEQWTINEPAVAEMTLSGGSPVGIPENLIGQTATVKGLSIGKATVRLSANDNSQGASATCEINVINSGDANGDGYLDNLDAALVLKYDAGLNEMTDEIQGVSDMNGDSIVDNLDAVIMLKYDAGLL